MNRVGWVFVASTVLCVLVSLVLPNKREVSTLTLDGVNFKTSPTFNVLSIGVVAILIGLYAWFW
jgi:SSS family solute:Na+ symporter